MNHLNACKNNLNQNEQNVKYFNDDKKAFSYQILKTLIYKNSLTNKETRVATFLLDSSNDDFVSYVSMDTISKSINVHKSSVYRAIQKLEEIGFIKIVQRIEDGVKKNAYIINVDLSSKSINYAGNYETPANVYYKEKVENSVKEQVELTRKSIEKKYKNQRQNEKIQDKQDESNSFAYAKHNNKNIYNNNNNLHISEANKHICDEKAKEEAQRDVKADKDMEISHFKEVKSECIKGKKLTEQTESKDQKEKVSSRLDENSNSCKDIGGQNDKKDIMKKPEKQEIKPRREIDFRIAEERDYKKGKPDAMVRYKLAKYREFFKEYLDYNWQRLTKDEVLFFLINTEKEQEYYGIKSVIKALFYADRNTGISNPIGWLIAKFTIGRGRFYFLLTSSKKRKVKERGYDEEKLLSIYQNEFIPEMAEYFKDFVKKALIKAGNKKITEQMLKLKMIEEIKNKLFIDKMRPCGVDETRLLDVGSLWEMFIDELIRNYENTLTDEHYEILKNNVIFEVYPDKVYIRINDEFLSKFFKDNFDEIMKIFEELSEYTKNVYNRFNVFFQ